MTLAEKLLTILDETLISMGMFSVRGNIYTLSDIDTAPKLRASDYPIRIDRKNRGGGFDIRTPEDFNDVLLNSKLYDLETLKLVETIMGINNIRRKK